MDWKLESLISQIVISDEKNTTALRSQFVILEKLF